MAMFLEKVRSEGLSHLSYIIGQGDRAAVIDPRRDCDVYLRIAAENHAAITHIFETHRNEDYVIGSTELARRTGAEIFHGRALDFQYGRPVTDGDSFDLGQLTLRVMETPGHTYESISIAVIDRSFGPGAVAVFTGDALFIGDVGRTDFFPDRPEEVAGLLYDSIFTRLLPLGDQVILLPAHGAGSVCGTGMADREFSTLGYERLNNPVLQIKKREEFIDFKTKEEHYLPPYFKQMEIYNQEGSAPELCAPVPLRPLSPEAFERRMNEGMLALDIRAPEAFVGAFIPGSLAIPVEMLPGYAGWFLPYDRPIGIVGVGPEDADKARVYLLRIGYDRIEGYLDGGLHAWETSGRNFDSIPAVHSRELVRRLEEKEDFTLLDVRTTKEFKTGRLPGSTLIYLGDLPHRLKEIPPAKPVVTFCGSGQRAIIAASLLRSNGFEQVEEGLGSMAACAAIGCPIISD